VDEKENEAEKERWLSVSRGTAKGNGDMNANGTAADGAGSRGRLTVE